MEKKRATQQKPGVEVTEPVADPVKPSAAAPVVFPVNLITTAASFEAPAASTTNALAVYRLRNTDQPASELVRNENAVLLRNALIDTAAGNGIAIPQKLRSESDPGSYIIQARGKIDDRFRRLLMDAGAEIISYVPNNAYLVRVEGADARALAAQPDVQSVLPYEPYFKLDMPVLPFAVEDKPMLAGAKLRLTLFPGELENTREAVQAMGVKVLAEDKSPFGPELIVQPMTGQVAGLAQLNSVQNMEFVYARGKANDLARERVGISPDTVSITNFYELSGSDVVVGVNDTGVDVSHPDLLDRVQVGASTLPTDTDGHGTHVAGIIASSGENGPAGENVPGSVEGASFRGMAHSAEILSFDFQALFDWELQQFPAETNYVALGRTNVLISNNSWNYIGAYEYNTAAASYDAAVRDAVPGTPGSQPVLFVFAAGNDGGGNDEGMGGMAGFINSPATAKNVITVGALESPRNITNEVIRTNQLGTVSTNAEFLGSTDSSNQVVRFSGRGNVGISVEGEFGRFKPDVVAPGSFIVSTRSQQWDTNSYYSPTNIIRSGADDLVIGAGQTNSFSLLLPENVVGYVLRVVPNDNSPDPFPELAFYVDALPDPSENEANLAGYNSVEADSEDITVRGDYIYFDIVNTNNNPVGFDLRTTVIITNNLGNYMEVLAGLNDSLTNASAELLYRYESGTSMAAPVISGMLALLQEYFQTQMPDAPSPSPALMKALLINGSRTVNGLYNLRPDNNINFQGWGMPSLEGILPKTNTIMVFDQDPTMALATDEMHVRRVTVSPNAQASSLRVSLVWTDPPGNPAVGVKLVNDLDLVVTNLATGDVYFGNNFEGSDFSSINIMNDGTNGFVVLNGNYDRVNNVENIYINGPLDDEYAVAVVGRRVNVNAVTTAPDGIRQDYALVISIGDLTITNALTVTEPDLITETGANVLPLTNIESSVPGQGYSLSFVEGQRVGANNPYEVSTNGTLNQWTFYTFTNTFGYTNLAFAIFDAHTLSGISPSEPPVPSVRNEESDVDLYVSADSNLTNLNETVLAAAHRSLTRGGDELIVLTNANEAPDKVYYIGVKSEDQRASEFGILAVASEQPFAMFDEDGNMVPLFFPVPQDIKDGSHDNPGKTDVFGIMPMGSKIRRLLVAQTIEHDNHGDLVTVLRKRGLRKPVVLHNHTVKTGLVETVYSDLDEGDIVGVSRTDGPGSLTDFIGEEARGLWSYTVTDNAASNTGRVWQLTVRAELLPEDDDGNGGSEINGREVCKTVYAGSQRYHSVQVPRGSTNLTVFITALSSGPLEIYVSRERIPSLEDYDYRAEATTAGDSVSIGLGSVPPLEPGRYFIMFYNPSASPIDACWRTRIRLDLSGAVPIAFEGSEPLTLDDAVTNSVIQIDDEGRIADINVGIRLDHPRVSDLSLRLVSPRGTRVLLFENRGGNAATGLGAYNAIEGTNVYAVFTEKTNLFPELIKFAQPPFGKDTTPISSTIVSSNSFETADGVNVGVVAPSESVGDWEVITAQAKVVDVDADFSTNAYNGLQVLQLEQEPDSDPVVYGSISGTITTEPGRRYSIRFFYRSVPGETAGNLVVDVNGETTIFTPEDRWQSFGKAFDADDTDATITISADGGPVWIDAIVVTELGGGHYYLPEEPLNSLIGEEAKGDWTLEIWDTREGGALAGATLDWFIELELATETPRPSVVMLTNGVSYTGTVEDEEVAYFMVYIPSSVEVVTNTLTSDSGGEVQLIFNQDELPVSGLPDNWILLSTASTSSMELNSTSTPELLPGQMYYLAVRNVNPGEANQFTLLVEFDQPVVPPAVTPLTNGQIENATIPAGLEMQYYQFDVSAGAVSVLFELLNADGNVDLYVSYGTPLPTFGNHDYASENPGNANESIVVTINTSPVNLAPGRWYIGVLNADTNDVNYSIRVTEVTVNVIDLVDGVSIDGTAPAGSIITTYYRLAIDQSNPAALFELYNLSGNGDLIVRQNGFPSLSDPDTWVASHPGTMPELIAVYTNIFPPDLNGDWYLAVVNNEATDIDFTIRASTSTDGYLEGAEPPRASNPTIESGFIIFEFSAIPGQQYEIQVSSNLVNWTTVETRQAFDAVETIFLPIGGDSMQFYRVVQVPLVTP